MTILNYEFCKILKNKSLIGGSIVLVLSIAAIFYIDFFKSQLTGIYGVTELFGIAAAKKNTDIVNKYEGELSDNKIKEVVTDYLKIYQEDTKDSKDELFFFYYFYWSIFDTFIPIEDDVYGRMIDATKNGEELLVDQVKIRSVKEIGFKDNGQDITIGNFKTWTILFEIMGKIFIATALFIILACSLLFASDTSKNILPLLLSTKYGRTKMIRSKLIAGILLTIGVFWLIQVITFFIFSCYYGLSGWNVSIQANFDWKLFDFPIMWNNLQVYCFIVVLYGVALLFIASMTMLVSSFCSSPFSTLAISLGLFFLPQILMKVFLTGLPNRLLYLFPVNNVKITKILSLMSQEGGFFFQSFFANIVLILSLMIFLTVTFNVVSYEKMKRVRIN